MQHVRRIILLVFFIGSLTAFTGCATSSSTLVPGADLSQVKKIYVVKLPKDERGVNRHFADRLVALGYQATTGEASAAPADIDAVLTYQDKWMWDITMYMLELNAQLRHPKTEMMLANARSYRPSLQRKSPPEMVEEVLGNMLSKKP